MKNLLLIPLLIFSLVAQAEWTHRYPKVDGQRHHIYLESYELPILSSGPKYPAASPDGQSLAFASNGWIWVLDLWIWLWMKVVEVPPSGSDLYLT